MLVFAFVVLFLPLSVGVTRASLLQVSPRVEEAARSVGRSPFSVLRTVTAPLVASGVIAGGALVFLTAIKELPATLILAPIGFETLATEIWSATSVGFFERGAVPSLVLLAISAVPLYLLMGRE
jgi:iron(III) transport system permease protein